jgi:hypothetical protein
MNGRQSKKKADRFWNSLTKNVAQVSRSESTEGNPFSETMFIYS